MTDPRFMRKKVVTGEIEADYENMCIMVHYELEVTIIDEDGRPVRSETKRDVKRIRLQSLSDNSNIPLLAEEIIDKCKLIHKSKRPLIEALVTSLKERKVEDDRSLGRGLERPFQFKKPAPGLLATTDTNGLDEAPSMKNLELYIEQLYDEDPQLKLRATKKVLKLARSQDNLEELANDDSLFGVLSRLLKEDSGRHVDLGIDIAYIFFCFSNYSQFHQFLSQNRVGDSTMRIIETELERVAKWETEIAQLQKQGGRANQAKINAIQKARNDLRSKQEQLLSVACHLLLNLAEDVSLEQKMRKRKLLQALLSLLDWDNNELSMVVLTFLKKLSIFIENKEDMARYADSLIPKVAKFLGTSNENLLSTALRLCFNLSFDTTLQAAMVKDGMIPKLVDLMSLDNQRSWALKVLYHLSIDDKNKPLFVPTELPRFCEKFVLESSNGTPNLIETLALLINLCHQPTLAEQIAEDSLGLILVKSKRAQDPLLMKIVRAISQHEGKCKELVTTYIPDLLQLLKDSRNGDFAAEILGALGNLSSFTFDWSSYLVEARMVEFFITQVTRGPSNAGDDAIGAEIIGFLGAAAYNRIVAEWLMTTQLILIMSDIVASADIPQRVRDENLLLQSLFTLYRLFQHEETRAYLLRKTKLVPILMNLIYDPNPSIREISGDILDTIKEHDADLANRLLGKKFQTFNPDWVSACNSEDADGYIPDSGLNLYY
eukprot:TRINITY_DN746_c0_g1_i1.p1 TRINITY_DN746_c0_g1~~TRINITY_DN746_c0_g1_i1.p1  ORF type:complete len:717 (+),score=121.49 TRINITY_DN746_c0_g1_i1:151-2301(+)